MADALEGSPLAGADDQSQSAVSIAAILAGAFANGALTLVLLAFGSAVGFSSVSPWLNAGVSAGTFKVASGLYLVVVALLASTVGGYMAGRLRTKWTGLHSEEVLFRDTAHGFLSWCIAGVMGVAMLSTAATFMVGGAVTGAAQGTTQAAAQASANPADYFVDFLLRPATASPAAGATGDGGAARREVGIILAQALAQGEDMPSSDRTYLSQLIAARTGSSPADADRRIAETVTQAKAAAEKARKAAAALSIWLTISMLAGAFAASLAAIEGGQLRDGTWKGIIGTKGYLRGRTT
jgi:hypothetical protein